MLPGLAPSVVRNALRFLSSSTSTTDATAVPSGAKVGDLLIAVGWSRRASSNPGQATLNNGWDEAIFVPRSNTQSNNYAIRVIYKKMTGTGDSGQELFNNETHTTTVCLAFRGGGMSPTAHSASGWCNTGNAPVQSTDASAGASPLVVIAVEAQAQSSLYSTTLSPSADGSVTEDNPGATGGELHVRASYKIYLNNPVDHSVDAPSTANVAGQAILYIEA